MPRRPRILLADYPLHIVQRGINREPCFFTDEDQARGKDEYTINTAAGFWILRSIEMKKLIVRRRDMTLTPLVR